MGVLDSKSKSSTSNQNIGVSEVAGPLNLSTFSGVGSGKNSTTNLTVSDAGAVQGTLALTRDLGLASLDLVRSSQASQAQASKDSVSGAYALANQARQSETSGAINNVLKYGAWIAGAALLAWVATRKRGQGG